MTNSPVTLTGSRFGVISDAHIHPGKSPPYPRELPEIFAGVDAILFLGDMGESAALDSLAEIAPVEGVRGGDDAEDDPRVTEMAKLYTVGSIAIGAVFDGTQHGLLSTNDPLTPLADIAEGATRTFGLTPDVLLCGGSHVAFAGVTRGILIVNPGSPTLAERRAVATLRVERDVVQVEHHYFV